MAPRRLDGLAVMGANGSAQFIDRGDPFRDITPATPPLHQCPQGLGVIGPAYHYK